MRVVLEIVDGPYAGRMFDLSAGQSLQIGRTDRAQCPLPDDTYLSGLHFGIDCEPDRVRLRDFGSTNGTYLNGVRVIDELLREGDRVQAGQTIFVVHVDPGAAAAQSPHAGDTVIMAIPSDRSQTAQSQTAHSETITAPRPALLEAHLKLMQTLIGQVAPLYAILDAGVEGRAPALLAASGEQYQSLYESQDGEELANVAPFLVRLPPQSPLLPFLITEAWGKSWVTWLSCPQELTALQRHLRRFIMLRTEDGKKFRFRFYDPRILQHFLPPCTPEEAQEFFGPVRSFLVEGEDADVLIEFTAGPQGVNRKEIALGPRRKEVARV
jgi:pSer/pThr/pTyr-binding forkhead associated (FHA) protein